MTDLQKTNPGAMTVPSYIPEGRTGTDHIGKDDVMMPRIGIAQALSPQLDESKPEYIEGLKKGHMFNTLTKQIYGPGPLEIVILRADPPRGIEFIPLEEGGGIKDPKVPLDDPRMKFTTGDDGKTEKPVATKFYDYIVMFRDTFEPIALSLKSTGLRVAKQLNALIKLRNRPIYTGVYKLSTITKTSGGFTYYVFVVSNSGWIDEESLTVVQNMHDSFIDREVKIDREQGESTGAPEEVPF